MCPSPFEIVIFIHSGIGEWKRDECVDCTTNAKIFYYFYYFRNTALYIYYMSNAKIHTDNMNATYNNGRMSRTIES